jgi:hypothetical protein
LRNAAKRQGLELSRSRRRDDRAPDYNRWSIRDRWNASRVVNVVQGAGWQLIDAPESKGGALRFAAWLTLDEGERLLLDGLICKAQPPQSAKLQRPQPIQVRGNWHGPGASEAQKVKSPVPVA